MKLSIILAVCEDTADRLSMTLESIGHIMSEDTELIIAYCTDDDSTAKRINEFVLANPSSHAYKTDAGAYIGGAYNKGLRMACGEYVSFISSGDILKPDFADAIASCMQEDESDVISFGYEYSDGSEVVESNNSKQNGEMDEANRCAAIISPGPYFAKIISKELFDRNGLWFTEENACPGGGVITLVMMYCQSFYYLDKTLMIKEAGLPEVTDTESYIDDMIMIMDFFMQECYKRELIEEYPEEIEYRYTVKGYLEPLFSYIESVGPGKASVSYVKFLRDSFCDTFPDFDTNPYYMAFIDEETSELVDLHMESPRKFVNRYKKK